jgi:hypothetical protein
MIGLDFTDTQVNQAVAKINGLRRTFAKKYGVPNMLKVKVHWDLNKTEK